MVYKIHLGFAFIGAIGISLFFKGKMGKQAAQLKAALEANDPDMLPKDTKEIYKRRKIPRAKWLDSAKPYCDKLTNNLNLYSFISGFAIVGVIVTLMTVIKLLTSNAKIMFTF